MPQPNPQILQANPKAAYLEHATAVLASVQRVLESGIYILGEEVQQFEVEFSRFVGASETVAVGSGTDALAVALRALGVGSGDLVATTSNTAVATVSAIYQAGAEPILIDVEPDTLTLSPSRFEEALETNPGKIKGVIPVHLYGHPADMPAIEAIAQRHGIFILEDCAQSHGASLNGRQTGTWGSAAAFSFYPTKNLGALGDAGAVTTSNPALAEQIRLLRQYGWKTRYISQINGINTRMDPVQAAILRVFLQHLAESNQRRAAIADLYTQGLAGLPLRCPAVRPGAKHAYHQYTIRSASRDRIQAGLSALGIPSAILYPVPIHLQPAYKNAIRIGPGGLPETELAASEILSLPLYPQIPKQHVELVIQALRQLLG